MISPIDAQYRNLRVAKYQGNPLIEALPKPLESAALQSSTTVLPARPTKTTQLSTLERKMLAEDLAYAFVLPPIAVRLYEEIYIQLCDGYLARNPVDQNFRKALYRIRDPFSAPMPGGKTASNTILFIGPTGFGKSAIARSVFSQLPTVITHTHYQRQPFALHQVVYLKIDCPSNGSSIAFLQNLWRAFDIALGTTYYEQYAKAKLTIPQLQKRIAMACATHAVGMLVVDEVHYLRPVLEDHNRERATLPFVDELLNGVGIPVLLIGTWKSARLLNNHNATTTRRVCSGLTLTAEAYPADNKYWIHLVKSLWDCQVCRSIGPLTDDLSAAIHQMTGGLPALLTKLLIAAQKRAMDTRKDAIDATVLAQVYRHEFALLHAAIEALHLKQFERFEDLLPRKIPDGTGV